MRKMITMMTMIRWMVKVISMGELPEQVVTINTEGMRNLMEKMQEWTTMKKETSLKTMKTTLMI